MGFLTGVLLFMVVCIIFIILRVVKGPTIWDRLMGFNMISMQIVMAIVVIAFIFDTSFYLDIALAYAILGFIGTILISGHIEKRKE